MDTRSHGRGERRSAEEMSDERRRAELKGRSDGYQSRGERRE
jgi:hypothetical protein